MSAKAFPHLYNETDKIALVEGDHQYTYAEVNQRINRFAAGLLGDRPDLKEERIAFFLPASLDYVTTMHGIWRAGAIAVPLNVASAVTELDHYLASASVTRLVTNADYLGSLKELCQQLDIELLRVEDLLSEQEGILPEISPERRALMLFTSGTTSKPKGVVSTHKTVRAQITTLVEAWAWNQDDSIPLFLPLHHIHGIINILSCG
ncbi:MAG: AMP-binding protein, partial [Pseudomonadales bacterium]